MPFSHPRAVTKFSLLEQFFMNYELMFFLLMSVLIGAIVVIYFLKQNIKRLENDLAKEQEKNKIMEENYKTEVKTAQDSNDFHVEVRPWRKDEGDKGVIMDTRKVEIGYQYQLFLRGIPCLASVPVITDVLIKKEVDLKRIKELTAIALSYARSINSSAIKIIDSE